jgi:hypothetical protein
MPSAKGKPVIPPWLQTTEIRCIWLPTLSPQFGMNSKPCGKTGQGIGLTEE